MDKTTDVHNAATQKWIMSIFAAVIIGISGWTLVRSVSHGEQMTLMVHQIEELAADKEADKSQDESLSKHWKLHSWAKDQITGLRNQHDMPVVSWPDLE